MQLLLKKQDIDNKFTDNQLHRSSNHSINKLIRPKTLYEWTVSR
jgi:hypothetical protein